MWRLPEEIEADLKSQEPNLIAAGLRDIRACIDAFELALLEVEILIPFGSTVPTETQLDFLRILTGYRSFQPRPSSEEVNHSLVTLVVRYADDRIALENALKLKSEPNPAAVEEAITFLSRHGLTSPRQVKGASYLVSYLIYWLESQKYALPPSRRSGDGPTIQRIAR
jgi:hypothetical protein